MSKTTTLGKIAITVTIDQEFYDFMNWLKNNHGTAYSFYVNEALREVIARDPDAKKRRK